MKEFLKKPQVKNVLLGVLTLVIGAFCSALGSWDKLTTSFWIKVSIAIILTIIYIVLLIFYSTSEVNERRIKEILEHKVKAYEEIMVGIDLICKQSASDVNSVIHEIMDEGYFNPKVWNFDKASRGVCWRIYALLGHLSEGSKDFVVSYVKLEEDTKPEIEISMNAFANQDMHKPSIYGIKRRIDTDDDRNYHDVELFRLGKSDIEVIIGSEKIDEVFSYNSKQDRKKNKKKYNQYIAIPVFCNDTKMIGLLEIVCLNETQLGINEVEVREIASKYLVPYSYLMLLLHKLEKALIVKPTKK